MYMRVTVSYMEREVMTDFDGSPSLNSNILSQLLLESVIVESFSDFNLQHWLHWLLYMVPCIFIYKVGV